MMSEIDFFGNPKNFIEQNKKSSLFSKITNNHRNTPVDKDSLYCSTTTLYSLCHLLLYLRTPEDSIRTKVYHVALLRTVVRGANWQQSSSLPEFEILS